MSAKKKGGKKDKLDADDKLAQKDLASALYGLDLHTSEGKEKAHKFWNKQPVVQDAEGNTIATEENEPLEVKTVDQVRTEPYKVPAAYTWSDLDVLQVEELDELYNLLTENYVEDDDNMFRFNYSREFLRWALTPPGFLKQFHVGIRVTKTRKLVGFISGIPADIVVRGKPVPMVEINFLCVHKKLRAKRLAPVLIKEITRRVNLTNVWQAVYTAGVVLPRPLAQNRYWHRSLNPKKLIDIEFSHLKRNMTIARTVKLYSLPKQTRTPGFRPMREEDAPEAHAMLVEYLSQFGLHQVYSLDEFKHWILPRDGVVHSYVVQANDGKITDFVSFYSLPSHVMKHPRYDMLNAAYSFYNVATTVPLKELMKDALIMAKKNKFDVFNALDVMENSSFLQELKFGQGDGFLQYYVYNWKCPTLQPSQVGLVLL